MKPRPYVMFVAMIPGKTSKSSRMFRLFMLESDTEIRYKPTKAKYAYRITGFMKDNPSPTIKASTKRLGTKY